MKEVSVSKAYEAQIAENGLDIVNTLRTIDLEGQKVWKGENGNVIEDSELPDEITVDLIQSGKDEPIASQTVKKSNSWKYSFTDLPEYNKDGQKYTYTVREREGSIKGYTPSFSTDGKTLTNQYTGEKSVTVKGTKTWVNDSSEKRPKGLELELYRQVGDNGRIKVEKVSPTWSNTDTDVWTYEYTNLPKYDTAGKEYKYTVDEVVPEGYISTKDGNNFKNTVPDAPEKTTNAEDDKVKVGDELTYTIKWKNNTGKDINVTINDTLEAGQDFISGEGATYDPQTRTVTWKDVKVKAGETVTKSFKVKITEDAAAKVENKATVKVGDNVTVYTNTTEVTPTTDISGEKIWSGDKESDRPDEITVKLYANGNDTGKTAEATKESNWKYEFKGLPKKDAEGDISYSVKEVLPKVYTDKYIPTYSKDENGKYIITNTVPDAPKKTASKSEIGIDKEFTYTIEWKNTTGKDVTVTITDKLSEGQDFVSGDGATYNPQTRTVTWKNVKVEAGGTLSKSFKAKLNDKAAAKEENKAGIDIDGIVTVDTNTTEVKPLIDISGIKTWSGDNDTDRPESITVRLMNGDKEVSYKTVTASDEWKYTFEDVPKYDSDGKVIDYTIKEDSVAGYVTSYDGSNITNYKPGAPVKTSSAADNNNEVTVGKNITYTIEWKNTPGKDVTATITDTLTKGQEYLADNEINKQNGAEYKNGVVSWKDVKVKKGETFKRSFVVKVTDEAAAVIENKAVVKVGDNVNIETNTTEITTKIDISGTKTWVGGDKDSRPAVTLILTRTIKGGTPETVTAEPEWSNTDKDVWTYKYSDLERADKDGNIYTYTVKEVPVKGYVASYDGNDITNTKPDTPEKTANGKTDGEIKVGDEITYTIKWTNNIGKDVTATITDTLTKGQEYLEDNKINKQNGAEYKDGVVSWKDVTIKDGESFEKSFVVRVTDEAEAVVENTAKVLIGDNVDISTNPTKLVTKINISGEKRWEDNDDNFKLRPDKITVKLKADGKVIDTKDVKPDETGKWNFTFSDLPLYKDGKKIDYKVEEEHVDGYSTTIDGYDITNKINEELFSWTGDITVDKAVAVKVNDEYAHQKVTDTFYFALFSDKELTKRATMKSEDGTETEIGIEKLELKNEASGTVTFKGVPTGTIKEPVKYYLAETDKDGVPVGEGFRYTPEFGESGSEVSLTVKDHDADLKVANVFDNKIDISGKKTWVDDNDKHKQRPDDITVFLKQNEEDYRDAQENTYAVHASKDTDWAYTFKDLPEFDENGDRYEYSVDEAPVAYYDAVIDGMDITNTFNKKKYYNDNPATITVTKETLLKGKEYEVNDIYYAGVFVDKDHTTLLADKEGAYIIPLVLENESSASFEFKVPYHEDGTATYYITEVTKDGTPVDKVSGLKYKASVKGGKVTVSAEDSLASVTFTNSYEQPKVPETGDSGLPWIWLLAGLMAAALAAAAWIIFGRRETRRL